MTGGGDHFLKIVLERAEPVTGPAEEPIAEPT
jgi:hypothetical protein